MVDIQLFNNPYSYPDYGAISPISAVISAKPHNLNSKGGTILFGLDFDTLSSANYIKIDFGQTVLYGWIENVEHRSGDKLYAVSYLIDAFRTYINQAVLGTQFVKRYPTATNSLDPMLRGYNPSSKKVEMTRLEFSNKNLRTLVVQISLSSTMPAGTYLNSPLQPTPYINYYCTYNINNWTQTQAIVDLITKINKTAKPINLVQIYTIPYIDLSSGVANPIPLEVSAGVIENVSGFKLLNTLPQLYDTIALTPPDVSIKKTPYTAQLVIPEGGILSIPEELLFNPNLVLRRDIDIYSGACNYSIAYNDNGVWRLTAHSVRTAGLSPIPVAYSPEQQLMAVNQTNRTTGLLGDVAGIVMGGAQVVGGLLASPVTGGVSTALAVNGGIQAGSSLINLFTRDDAMKDTLNTHQSPPAFLGSALLHSFADTVHRVITTIDYTNATEVNSLYGYPQNKLMPLILPNSGFVQTQECCISGDGIPNWARQEINNIFNTGIRIK